MGTDYKPLMDDQLCAITRNYDRPTFECLRAVETAAIENYLAQKGQAGAISDEAYCALAYVESSLSAIANQQEVAGDLIVRIDTLIGTASKRAKSALACKQAVADHFEVDAVTPQDVQVGKDAERVINNAREAMNASYEESVCDSDGIVIPSHLAAALSLALDEYDAAIAAAKGKE